MPGSETIFVGTTHKSFAWLPSHQYNESGPKFSMAMRLPDEGDKMKVPGPGSYDAGDIDMCREKLPAFTMAPKTSIPSDHTTKPAPNAYAPEKVGLVVFESECAGLKKQEREVVGLYK